MNMLHQTTASVPPSFGRTQNFEIQLAHRLRQVRILERVASSPQIHKRPVWIQMPSSESICRNAQTTTGVEGFPQLHLNFDSPLKE